MVADDMNPFVGRTGELAVLRRLVPEARSGRPPHRPADRAGRDRQDLAGRAVPRRARRHHSAARQRGAVGGIGRLRGGRPAATHGRGARGCPAGERRPGSRGSSPSTWGAVLLTSVEDLERRGLVVLLIDDAHWADVDSLRALLFTLRRLVGARVLTLLVARAEDAPRAARRPAPSDGRDDRPTDQPGRARRPKRPAAGAAARRGTVLLADRATGA